MHRTPPRQPAAFVFSGCANSAQIGLCVAESGLARKLFFDPRRASSGGAVALSVMRARYLDAPRRRARLLYETALFACFRARHDASCICMPEIIAVQRRRRSRRHGRAGGNLLAEEKRTGVLTVEKSVIRFRPNRCSRRQRVSRNQTKTRRTNKHSAPIFYKVDAGAVSLMKTSSLQIPRPCRSMVRAFQYPRRAPAGAAPPSNPSRSALRAGGCVRVRYPHAV